MVERDQIRRELRDIRYYYSKKNMFDAAFKETGGNNITELVQKYNLSIKEASPRLYDIYISLYMKGNTQEGVAEEILYSSFYVYKLNNKLVKYFYKKFNENAPK